MKKYMLAIETSCDETAIAILHGQKIISNVVYSQIGDHSKFGGVVPELASREHQKKILGILQAALMEANITLSDIKEIAVTTEPGLLGALMVGKSFALGLSRSLNIPIIEVNHVIGHAFSITETANIKFPYLALIASGGHTQFMLFNSFVDYEIIGATTDDSIGESFDKVSKMMNLGYPGGPIIEKLAKNGQANVAMPRIRTSKYEFSFSGLKAHVKRLVDAGEYSNEDIAASFQKKVFDEVLGKLEVAIEEFNPATISIVGGVSANKYLRDRVSDQDIKFATPILATDNAAMIGLTAHYQKVR